MADPSQIPVSGRELTELALLFEISQVLDRSLELADVVDPVLKLVAEHLRLERAALTLLNRHTGEMRIEAAYGLLPQHMERGRYRLGEGVTGTVAQTGEPAVIPRIADASGFLDRTGARTDAADGELSFICVPVKLGNEVLGTLSADRAPHHPGSLDADVRLLATIASMIAQAVRLRQRAQEDRERLVEENARLREALQNQFSPKNIIGRSKAMRQVYDMIARVTTSDATVLVRGESGVGKELVAQAIHFGSHRADKAFVKVNCAALPGNLLESELFGHERGAFTGAVRQRKGRFELAHGGTIFLDEIGDFPLSTQGLLLRVLQEKEVERVGGTQTIRTDVRVIAATNRDLDTLVAEGRFREDLYYRLNVYPIQVPPLRERRTDIPLLADFFVERYSKANRKVVKRVSTPAIDMLMSYHWPGNVRELENCIERAVLLSDDEVIHGRHLPPTLQTAEATGTGPRGPLKETLARVERDLIIDALKACRGNMAKAARQLGITERMMGLRVARYGIVPTRFRGG